MDGLWTLLAPLRLMGLNVERFTVRMLLTLHYVEQMAVQPKLKLDFSQLDKLALASDEPDARLPLILAQPAFSWFDKAMLSLMLLAVMGLSLSKFAGAVNFFKVWQA
jgi:energy-coupling factor transport system permease protein